MDIDQDQSEHQYYTFGKWGYPLRRSYFRLRSRVTRALSYAGLKRIYDDDRTQCPGIQLRVLVIIVNWCGRLNSNQQGISPNGF